MKVADLAVDLEKKGVRPLYALVGPELYFRDQSWRLIRSQILAQDPTAEVRTAETDPSRTEGGAKFELARLLADLATPTLFSRTSGVRLRQVDKILADHRDRFATYIESPPAGVTLVLDLDGLDRRTKLAKRLESIGAVVECPALFASPPPWSNDPPHENDLAKWVRQEVVARGKTIRLEDAQVLCERVGANLFALVSEIDKLAGFVGKAKSIGAADVRALVGASRRVKIFELTESVFAGRAAEALARADRLFDEGVAEASGRLVQQAEAIALMTLGALSAELRRVRAAREWLVETRGAGGERALAEKMGVKPFAAGRLLSLVRRVGPERIAEMVRTLDECDRDLKGGRGPAEWVLTRTVWQLTRAAPGGRTTPLAAAP